MPEQRTWRRAAIVGIGLAAAAAFSSGAGAACRFPDGATETPAAAARLLLDGADVLGFAVVKRRLDGRARRPEEVSIIFPLKGPQQTLTLRSPFVGDAVTVGNYEASFEAAEGTLVFAALRNTPAGWVISECDAQLLNAFPLEALVPELRRQFLRRHR